MSELTLRPGELVVCSPLVRRLTQDNPGPFTGRGTNTHLVGRDSLFVLDPGQEDETHFQRIVEEVGEAPVLGVLPTHAHPDHWPLAPRLGAHFDTPTYGFAERNGYHPDRTLVDGQTLHGGGATLEVHHTPGHASDHVCFLLSEERSLFSGDLVMAWSTSVIAPPDGNLNQFYASLARLRELDFERMYPAHGLPIEASRTRIDEIERHRRMRTEQALAALADGLETIPAMVERIYTDVDPRLRQAAGMSLLAHLEALIEDGQVRAAAGTNGPEGHYRLL